MDDGRQWIGLAVGFVLGAWLSGLIVYRVLTIKLERKWERDLEGMVDYGSIGTQAEVDSDVILKADTEIRKR